MRNIHQRTHSSRLGMAKEISDEMLVMAMEDEKCPFCGKGPLVHFHEHYYFCTDCTVMYTEMIVHKSDCEHIKEGVLTVHREPWYKDARNKVYIKIMRNGGQECSLCGAACLADGW